MVSVLLVCFAYFPRSWADNYADAKRYAEDIVVQSGKDLWDPLKGGVMQNCTIRVDAPGQKIPNTTFYLTDLAEDMPGTAKTYIRGECSDPAYIEGEVTFGCYVAHSAVPFTFIGLFTRPLGNGTLPVKFNLSLVAMLLEFKKKEGELPRLSTLLVLPIQCDLTYPVDANNDAFLKDQEAFADFRKFSTEYCCRALFQQVLEKRYRYILEGNLLARSVKFPMP